MLLFHGVGKICVCEKTMYSGEYIQVLEDYLIQSLEKITDGGFIYQDDNAPCHRSKKVEQWMESKNITRSDWPSQSPDLNHIQKPMEHFEEKTFKKIA